MRKVTALLGKVKVVIPVPPYLLYGTPCVVCQKPARSWYPGQYVVHGPGRFCRLHVLPTPKQDEPQQAAA